jgi:hypothetical protein
MVSALARAHLAVLFHGRLYHGTLARKKTRAELDLLFYDKALRRTCPGTHKNYFNPF